MEKLPMIKPNKMGIDTFSRLNEELSKLGVAGDASFIGIDNITDRIKELVDEGNESYFSAVSDTGIKEGLVQDRFNKAIRLLELAKIYDENFGF